MADIVVLYSRRERQRLQPILGWLQSLPWSIWIDDQATEGSWTSIVEAEIEYCRCVLPIWSANSRSDESFVPGEVAHAQTLGKPRIHVRIDEVTLPIHVALEIDTFINLEQPEDGLEKLQFRLAGVLADDESTSTPNSILRRPPTLISASKEYPLPTFVRSVSSYETPLVRPEDALLALELFPSSAPILISSFDLSVDGAAKSFPDRQINLTQFRASLARHDEQGRILFLDSGNYEAYRLQRGKNNLGVSTSEQWLFEDHKKITDNTELIDFALSFDEQMVGGTQSVPPIADREAAITAWCTGVSSTRPSIPVVHPIKKNDGTVNFTDLGRLLNRLVSALDFDTVAIPERDLGDGIAETIRAVKSIRQLLNRSGRYRLLHLLGTGNPYTILLLAAAGADLFDGLEWCRLVVDGGTGRLHHPHHFDMFISRMKFSDYDAVRELHDSAYPETFKVLIHNLDFFDRWMQEVRSAVDTGTSVEMLSYYLGAASVDRVVGTFQEVLEEDVRND